MDSVWVIDKQWAEHKTGSRIGVVAHVSDIQLFVDADVQNDVVRHNHTSYEHLMSKCPPESFTSEFDRLGRRYIATYCSVTSYVYKRRDPAPDTMEIFKKFVDQKERQNR